MSLRKLVLILLGILSLCYMSYRLFRSTNIDKEVNQELVENAVLLDVRTEWEFKRGGLPNSVNIKMSDLRTVTVQFEKDTPIITYCSYGMRSIKARSILKKTWLYERLQRRCMNDLKPYFEEK